jgi:hypothetical protein
MYVNGYDCSHLLLNWRDLLGDWLQSVCQLGSVGIFLLCFYPTAKHHLQQHTVNKSAAKRIIQAAVETDNHMKHCED